MPAAEALQCPWFAGPPQSQAAPNRQCIYANLY
jgi:hypothetical protein